MFRYDEANLVGTLATLRATERVAFAAACAERLFPAYLAFCQRTERDDHADVRSILDHVWDVLVSEGKEVDWLPADLEGSAGILLGEDRESWSVDQAYADDAAAAVVYTLRALRGGNPQEAGWAARRAYEAVDHYVAYTLGLEDENEILNHPLVQAELARQERDLDELRTRGSGMREVVIRLRDRARSEGRDLTGGDAVTS